MSLQGRSVVVTGASRGIGAEVARTVASLRGGVVLVARSADALDVLAGELPTPVAVVVGDVADPAVADRAAAAMAGVGRPWGLVNNAGISPYYAPVTDTPDVQWEEILRVNLLGAVAMSRSVGRLLSESGGGRIVNIGSIAGHSGLPNIGAYNASKAALDALTRTLCVELGPRGVCVNSICPGTIATEMVADLMAKNPALSQKFIDKTAIGRVGAVEEAAWPIAFLLTDAAAFITGQAILVDGGRMASA